MLDSFSANPLKVDKNCGELNLPALMSFGSMYLPNIDVLTT